MDALLISSAIGVGGTLSATLIATLAQREAKKLKKLQEQAEKYRIEIVARIALERVAMSWLHDGGLAQSTGAARDELRNKAYEMCGYRPSLYPADVSPNNLIARK